MCSLYSDHSVLVVANTECADQSIDNNNKKNKKCAAQKDKYVYTVIIASRPLYI